MHGHTALMDTASGGDPTLLRAFTVIGDRASAFSDVQLAALRALVQGWVAPAGPGKPSVATAPEPTLLTARQRQILALLSEGLTVQAIAHRLYLSPRTVGKHLERLYRRLGTSDRLTTVLQAQRFGLLAARPAYLESRHTQAS
jgi:DNA-binding NarL/FixJ family response regulator